MTEMFIYFMLTVAPGGNNLATIRYKDFLCRHYKYVLLLLLLLLLLYNKKGYIVSWGIVSVSQHMG